jgi:hypothetical protein
MSSELTRLLRERKLLRIRADRKLVLKEIEGASYDLRRARKSLDDDDAKWAIVKAYYAMFHAARALLFSKGFREKSHRALLAALRELFRSSIEPALFVVFLSEQERSGDMQGRNRRYLLSLAGFESLLLHHE